MPVRLAITALALTATAAGPGPAASRDCACWHSIRVGAGSGDTTLGAVAAPSARTAWAVGSRGSGPLLIRWTGDRWHPERTPLPTDTLLTGVAAASAADAWIVGYGADGTPRTAHWTTTVQGTALDGRMAGWDAGRLPGGPGFPRAVAARGARDAWVVGSAPGGDSVTRAMTWHWDGAAWRAVPVPDGSGLASDLSAVSARTATDVWAVGGRGAFPPRPLVLHGDGTAWTPRPLPDLPGEAILSGVVAQGPADVWIVGGLHPVAGTATTPDKPLAARWDGRRWQVMTVPRTDGRFFTVVGDGHGGIWAGGSRSDGSPLFAHWTPKGWDLSGGRTPEQAGDPLTRNGGSPPAEVWALARIPRTDHLWAVGSQNLPSSMDSLHSALTWTNAPRPR